MKEKTLKPRATEDMADPYPEDGVKAQTNSGSTPTVSHQLAWYSDTLVGSALSGQTLHHLSAGDTAATAFAKLDKQVNIITTAVNNSVVASITASNSGITIGGTTTAPTVGVAVSSGTGNQISISGDGLYVPTPPAQTDYSVTCTSGDDDNYAKVYTFYQSGTGTTTGTTPIATINIPKDLVVSSGSVITATSETGHDTVSGQKYVKLDLANSDNSVYIAVNDLVDVYTAGSGATQVQLAISDSNIITGSIVAGSIGTTELADGSVTEAKIASGAVTSGKLATNSITTDKIVAGAVDATKLAAVASGTTETVSGGTQIATAGYVQDIERELGCGIEDVNGRVDNLNGAFSSLNDAKVDKEPVTSGNLLMGNSASGFQDTSIDSRNVVDAVSNSVTEDNVTTANAVTLTLTSGNYGEGATLSATINPNYIALGTADKLSTSNKLVTEAELAFEVGQATGGKVDKAACSSGNILVGNGSSGMAGSDVAVANVVTTAENGTNNANVITLGTSGHYISGALNAAYVSGTVNSGTNKLMTYEAVSGLIAGAASHSHGNINYSGELLSGSTKMGGKAVITDANGLIVAGDLSTSSPTTTAAATATTNEAITAVAQDATGKLSGLTKHYIKLGNITHEGKLVSGTTEQASKVLVTNSNGEIVAGEYDGTYSATNKIATQSTVSTAIGNLSGAASGTSTDGRVSVTVVTENGEVSGVTVTTSGIAASDHTHGYITNDGKLSGAEVWEGCLLMTTSSGLIRGGDISGYINDTDPDTPAVVIGTVVDGGGFTQHESITLPSASRDAAGLMSSASYLKLNGIDDNAQVNVIETVKVDGTALTVDANKAVNIDLDGSTIEYSGSVVQVKNSGITTNKLAALDYVVLTDKDTNTYSGQTYAVYVQCGRLVVSGIAAA